MYIREPAATWTWWVSKMHSEAEYAIPFHVHDSRKKTKVKKEKKKKPNLSYIIISEGVQPNSWCNSEFQFSAFLAIKSTIIKLWTLFEPYVNYLYRKRFNWRKLILYSEHMFLYIALNILFNRVKKWRRKIHRWNKWFDRMLSFHSKRVNCVSPEAILISITQKPWTKKKTN